MILDWAVKKRARKGNDAPDHSSRVGGGGKLGRSEIVTVRLDPKLRYLAELGARKQRRTVSSFTEWAIEESLKSVFLRDSNYVGDDHEDQPASLSDEASYLWDVDEPDRFAKLALDHPDLLTHEEQLLWKLIENTGCLWRGNYTDSNDPARKWIWKAKRGNLIVSRLRAHWETLKAVSKGQAPRSTLPTGPYEEKRGPRDPSDVFLPDCIEDAPP